MIGKRGHAFVWREDTPHQRKACAVTFSFSTALTFRELWLWFHISWRWGLPQQKLFSLCIFCFFKMANRDLGELKTAILRSHIAICRPTPGGKIKNWYVPKAGKCCYCYKGLPRKAMRRQKFWLLNQQFSKVYFHLWFSQVKAKLVGSTGTLVGVREKHTAGISLMLWTGYLGQS